MSTYLDARTGELKPRHTDVGAPAFTPNPDYTWSVSTQGQLMDATRKARSSGGTIRLETLITVDEVVPLYGGTKVIDGGIRAADVFAGGHLAEIRGGAFGVWLDNVELDANGMQVRTLPIMENSRAIILSECRIHGGQVGVTISNGSSDILIINCASHDHHTWHGFAVQHTDCERIAILGCRAYANAAYGIDSHGTNVEVAGCWAYDNGQNASNYEGGCTKFPEAHRHYIHDNTFQNDGGGGYGCVWTYGDPGSGQRRPLDVMVYRNTLIGSPHYRTGKGAELRYWDNATMRMIDGEPQRVPAIMAGSGECIEDPTLGMYPTEIDDKTQPVPPSDELTPAQVAQVRAIYNELFAESVQNLEIEVRFGSAQ